MVENEKELIAHTLDITDILDLLSLDVVDVLNALDESGYIDENAKSQLLRACE